MERMKYKMKIAILCTNGGRYNTAAGTQNTNETQVIYKVIQK
jgi:hypothetical protein